jgi:hypothetical protein
MVATAVGGAMVAIGIKRGSEMDATLQQDAQAMRSDALEGSALSNGAVAPLGRRRIRRTASANASSPPPDGDI